jgi:flagellar biosynthesis/type III secretory pathway protein FliH
MKAQDPKLLARLTVRKVFNRYQAAARAVAEDSTPEQLADADIMGAALHQYADSALESIAHEAANQAFQSGRADGLTEVAKETGAAYVWRRASVLEDSTCANCEAADGTEVDGPDDDLSDICEGGEQCRCITYADMDEVRAAA